MFLRYLIVALAVVSCASAADSACHANCVCKWKQGKRWASCQGKNMITVPNGLPSEIQVIDLEKNNFHTLPTKIFQERGLTNLQKIYLQHCRLGRIAVDSLHQLTNLVELDLSHNLLTEIPTEALMAASHLRKLHLNNNPISELTNGSFKGLDHLQHLSLSGCQVHHIDVAAFASLESLKALYLDTNRLTTLRAETVSTLPRITELTLTGNPWHCDCHLAPLRKWMIRRSIGNLYAPHCASPERIREVSWTELDVEDFACLPEIALQLNMLHVHVEEGANVTLVCGVRSQPVSVIRWEPAEISNETYMDPDRYHTKIDDAQQGLQVSYLCIDHAQLDDSGVYVCVSENKAGITAANFTLHVTKQLLNPTHLGRTGTITVIALFVLVAILIALGLCFFVMRQRHRADSDTKVPPNQSFLKQLAVVKTVKGAPEVIPVVAASPKSEFDGVDKRAENGSSGYGSDQTPDLVNKIGFDKEIHLYNGPVGNGYANPADPAYRHSPMMSQLNTTYQQDDYALGPIPGEAALGGRAYSPEPLPPVHPANQRWTQSATSPVDVGGYRNSANQSQTVGIPTSPSMSQQNWAPAPAVPPRAPMAALVSPHGDTRYSPDEGYAEETICYEGTEV
ncbi:leucine-rich repeat-containing protein 24-like [Galendromus occidentalis]|uniref:Leucine-rich repeat-containing protein 24-like n=1 Tax=Galendromus occidentalis TaxID=34638 RepID=A0AAJ7WHF9_9ACAR|nr:leucine-rich repeat-containing protein 24-like [Galendromus occidentalis]